MQSHRNLLVTLALLALPARAQHQHGAPPAPEPPAPEPPAHVHAPTPAAPAAAPPAPREEPRIAVEVVPEQQARIGLRTAAVVKAPVHHSIRAVGTVTIDERREAHVHTRVAGFIDEIYVAAVGTEVKRGQVLYRLFAPELTQTQQELVASRAQGELGARIAKAALERLAQYNVAPFEIEALRAGGAPKKALAFVAPVDGFVLAKSAIKGMYVTPDMELYHLADLSQIWVVVSLYEGELPLVAAGDLAEFTLSAAPGRSVRAPLSYVYPQLDPVTRTGKARIEVANLDGALRPGMFTNVTIEKDLGEALVIPEDALIFTGQRNLVFRKEGATRFAPVEVKAGPRVSAGRVVLSGLQAGDEVVVQASFLIDAESRLKAALQRGKAPQGHSGHGG